jgi:transglutaminase-like putative cysteine protease
MVRGALLVLSLGLLGLALAHAQQRRADPKPDATGPVLHEYIPEDSRSTQLDRLADAVGPGRLPASVPGDAQPLARPDDGLKARPDERPVASRADRRTGRDQRTLPDRETRHEGVLHYQAVFNPSVVPFKRVSTQDAVDERFGLLVRDPEPRPLPVAPLRAAPDRTLFWGSLLLEAVPGAVLPLPSVSPDMEVHGYETVPRGLTVRFFRDGADSFGVSVPYRGKVRLKFLVSGANRYFSPDVALGLSLADVPVALRPTVPPAVAAAVARMRPRLDLPGQPSYFGLLNALVRYFRGFEEGPLPVQTGNVYEDLTVAKRGVCRHRSYAFVVTALALGLPARYVTNEAHAFVEVWVPRAGWARVDLGGAASELRVSNAGEKEIHRPVDDPFARPPQYDQSYTRLTGNVTGLSRRQRQGPVPRQGHGSQRRLPPDRSTPDPTRPGDPDPTKPGDPATTVPARPAPRGDPVKVLVLSAGKGGVRGDPLTVTGRLAHATSDRGLASRSVEVYLRRPGSDTLVKLGDALTSADGQFTLRTTIPLTVDVGTYAVMAFSAADALFQEAWSE